MLSQSETQTGDQHYWPWIPTGILTPSESKCDWLTHKTISVFPSLCPHPHPPAPMPFFCLQRSRYHGLLSFPLERNMVSGEYWLFRPDIQRSSRDWEKKWNTALGAAGFSVGWRTGHRIWPYCAQYHKARGCMGPCCRVENWDPNPKWLPMHAPSLIVVKSSFWETQCDLQKGLFHFLHPYTDFSTSCTHAQTFPLSLFCSKLFFLTCICISVSEAETGEGRHAGHYEYEHQPFQ